jgi:hypothetical protein
LPRHRKDGFRNLRWGKQVNRNRNGRSAIERQAARVPCGEIGLICKDWTAMFSSATTGERSGQFHFQVDQQRTCIVQEQFSCCRSFDRPSTQCQHQLPPGKQPNDGCMLQIAKGRLAVTREKLGDRAARFCFDHIIDIDKAPAEMDSHKWTDRRLPRSHKTSKDDAPQSIRPR